MLSPQESFVLELIESDEYRELDDDQLALVETVMADIMPSSYLQREKRQERESGEASPLLKAWRQLRLHVLYTKRLRMPRKSRHADEDWGPDSDKSVDDKKGEAPPSINSRMIDTLQNDAQSKDWTTRQWAEHLGCSSSTVTDQPTWDELMKSRTGEAFTRGSPSRRRLPKKRR